MNTDKLKAAQAVARARKSPPSDDTLVSIVVVEGARLVSSGMTERRLLPAWLQQQIDSGRLVSVRVTLTPPEVTYLGSTKGD